MPKDQIRIIFTGKAGEYFGIWIVNLILSIITFGIYSAWAKVRRKKYFYKNTLIEGVSFDYHANPMAILKGRIIAFTLFVLFNVLAGYSPLLYGIFLICFTIALPWIIVRGFSFNARNSSHRGLRFDFDGNYRQAAMVMLAYPLLALITLGLALPFAVQRSHQFITNHHKFGQSNFDMQASVRAFYMIYLKLMGAVILIIVLLATGLTFLTKNSNTTKYNALSTPIPKHKTEQSQQTDGIATAFIQVAEITDALPRRVLLDNMLNRQVMPSKDLATKKQIAADTTQPNQEYVIKNMLPKQKAQFKRHLKVVEDQIGRPLEADVTVQKKPFEKMLESYGAILGPIMLLLFLGTSLLFAVGLFIVIAYIRSRIANLVWSNTKLEHIGFFSNQRMRDLIWLYLSNIIVLILTIGLASPWVQIRMARYRLSRLVITGETNWDQFIGDKKQQSKALGEEIANMFDIDLSFG